MEIEKRLKIFAGLLSIFTTMPIWFFILYSILKQLDTDRLVWFLFWIYVPISFLIGIIAKFVGDD